jgi:hypothetical protein
MYHTAFICTSEGKEIRVSLGECEMNDPAEQRAPAAQWIGVGLLVAAVALPLVWTWLAERQGKKE